MTQLIDKLHRDHVHMAELLELLAREVTVLQDPHADADYHLMREVAHYFTAFPDTVHHPVEDEVYGALREKRPDLAARLDAIEAEHAELAELGRDFHRLMQNVCAGQVVRRETVLSEAENFLARQQGHMNVEEGEIFPAARAALSDADLADFEARHGAHADPVFGPQLRDGFSRLHEAIVTSA